MQIDQIVANDPELNGAAAKAIQQTDVSQFQLILAMLQQNLMERPEYPVRISNSIESEFAFSSAPSVPLSTKEKHLKLYQIQSIYVQQAMTDSCRLMQSLHPLPLSQYNDAKRLGDEVIENCDWHTRGRLEQQSDKYLPTEITNMHEVVEASQGLLSDLSAKFAGNTV